MLLCVVVFGPSHRGGFHHSSTVTSHEAGYHYTVYLGLDNEYEILRSDQFADRIENLTAEPDIDIVTSNDELITDIKQSGNVEDDD